MERKEIDILDVLLVLAKYKKIIFWTVLLVSIGAVTYSLLVPKYWEAKAKFVPVSDSSLPLNFIDGDMMSVGASLLGVSSNPESYSLLMLMRSRPFSEDVITKFGIIDYLELKDKDKFVNLDEALLILYKKIVGFSLDTETGAISITALTKSKKMSADMANYYCTKLNEYNMNDRTTTAKRRRIFLEKRVAEVRSKIDTLSKELLVFQKENNIIDIDSQVIENLNQYSTLIASKIQSEIKYELALETTNKSNPMISTYQRKIELLDNEIFKLENEGFDYKFSVPLNDISELGLNYKTILSELDIQKAVFKFLYPQFEQARIDEVKDLPTIDIIEHAREAGLRAKPKRATICIAAFLLSFFISSILVYSYHLLKQTGRIVKVNQLFRSIFSRNE